jgi:deazaflavin-dependent oxidoreductase (nitroreductase family)
MQLLALDAKEEPMSTVQPGPLMTKLLRAPARLYDWHGGWLLGSRFLRLTHQGRRSGRTYQTVLEVLCAQRSTDEFVVIAGFGPNTDWYRNLQAGSAIKVSVGRRQFAAQHRVLPESEVVTVLADYERRHRWATPVLRRVLTRLLGWRYDGSAEARARLARQLPLVALRPA